MPKSSTDILKTFAWPAYFIAFLLIATPVLDFVTNVLPIRVGDVNWRYGSVGLLAGFLMTPLLGILFALGAAVTLGHRLVLRTMSILNIVCAFLFLILIGLFALDVVQVRVTIPTEAPAEARSMFVVGAIKSAVKYLAMAAALTWLGIAGLQTTQKTAWRKQEPLTGAVVPLVRSADKAQSEDAQT